MQQGCGLGRDVSISRRSRDVLTSRLGLEAICLGLGPVGLVSGLGALRLVETFCAGARRAYCIAAVRAILTSMTFVA